MRILNQNEVFLVRGLGTIYKGVEYEYTPEKKQRMSVGGAIIGGFSGVFSGLAICSALNTSIDTSDRVALSLGVGFAVLGAYILYNLPPTMAEAREAYNAEYWGLNR